VVASRYLLAQDGRDVALWSCAQLNVNFNQIETLDNLQCAGLEKLFMANNQVGDCIGLDQVFWCLKPLALRLQVVDISPLHKLIKLNTLSVYGNRIADLDAALHTCRSLPKVRAPRPRSDVDYVSNTLSTVL
jgi:Leucine-rich repeat (LRR) protein